jgi:hypothetical protein
MDLAPETATVRQADGSWTELPAKEVARARWSACVLASASHWTA